MRFLLKGRLCATLCDDCRDPLSKVTVRLSSQAITVTGAVEEPTAPPFALLSPELVVAKRTRLVAEVRTDEDGYFYAEIDEASYQGRALEIDLVQIVERGQRDRKLSVEHVLHVGVIQPFWRESADCYLAAWAQCLPKHVWCRLRGMAGQRTLSGHIRDAITGQLMAGVRVRACREGKGERPVGEAYSDSRGRFEIRCAAQEMKDMRLSAVLGRMPEGISFQVEAFPGAQPLQVNRARWCGSPDACPGNASLCVDIDVEKGLAAGRDGSSRISIMPRRIETDDLSGQSVAAAQ